MSDAGTEAVHRVRRLEECALNAWPALATLVVDGWLLRFAEGYTKRANSINAWRPAAPLASILGHAAALYAARDLPAIVRITPLAPGDTDACLAARGFTHADETIVMTAPLGAAAAAQDASVTVYAEPTEAWSSGFAAANAVPGARRAVHDRMLAAIQGPRAFASITDGDRPIGWGLAAVERGFAGLFDIVTLPAARRRGAARRLVGTLLTWAAAHGAHTAYLQVVTSNAPAIALYRRLGFAEAYRYHYRIAPA